MTFDHVVSYDNSSLLRINNIGCSDDPQNNRFGPGMRDIWLIHYVTKGKGYFNGHIVNAGQGFLINRRQFENYFPDKIEPWEFLWITSDDDSIKYFFDQYDVDEKTQIFNYDFTFVIKNIMHYIKENHNKILKNEEILEIFLHIFNYHNNQKVKNKSNADRYIDFFVNYIKTHLHNQLKIKAISEIIGVSSTYLFQIFKNKFDISPKQYISNLKLHTAKNLLMHSNLSITEISNSVGFSDVLVFSRFFHSKEGISPTEYRNQSQKSMS
ncbi:MAG: AraC family transcriptional regulator [Acutalibacteraceae bacterium]|nr:AraC family transcriptional regulator [Acutalibacteraceae bacterium]